MYVVGGGGEYVGLSLENAQVRTKMSDFSWNSMGTWSQREELHSVMVGNRAAKSFTEADFKPRPVHIFSQD